MLMRDHSQITNGYPHFMWQGNGANVVNQITQGYLAFQNALYGDTTHWPELERADYLIEGERYILQNWIDEAEARYVKCL